jgi:ribosomal-protein-alanine N-acetyltransferase
MNIILETKRLILKQPTLSDFDGLLRLRTDPQVMQYIGTGDIQTEKQVKEFIENAKPYSDEYGLGFYSVFEKETHVFIGQAGLFHLGFNVNQPDIELAYRLDAKYWNKGYATELAKALIEYGFNKFSLPKIVAMVHPKNDRSRRVMEKAGMFYHGMINFKEELLPCYEILNHKVNFNEIKLIPATLNDYPSIQNMGRFYVYDMSEYLGKEEGWEIPEDGLYECIDFKKYWEDKSSFPFLVRYQNEIVGFVIIDKKGSDSEIDFNMAQFFILRKFKNKGIGSYIAQECFKKFPGIWEVMVIPGNEGAYRFWRAAIKNYTQNNFTEYTRDIPHFNNSRKNIFKFDSRIVP